MLFLLYLVLLVWDAGAQTSQSPLYMPIEFQKAYQKGTRKWDGSVSPSYWQNRSEYTLKAKIDPHQKLLEGSAKITYYNNSLDTMRRPTFHTYHDYYRADSKKSGFFSNGDVFPTSKGVVISKLIVDGESYDVKDPKQLIFKGTHYIIALNKPLLPKGKITLEINWNYPIPGEGFERSGAIDSTSMFIGYWYPEIAVFDDIDGWDRIVYDAATEFYHDYSDYSVEIEAPDNFMLWASVAPDNPTEVYSTQIQKQLTLAKKSTEPVSILTEADFSRKPSAKMRTWKYTAKNFPDFSFALSDHFVWDAAMYKDDKGEYLIHAAYPPSHTAFKVVVPTIAASLKIFHTEFPAYPFPYKNFTIFNGLQGGGMEFPGMANNESVSGEQMEKWTGVKTSDFDASLGLSLHEMCHMYFPFLMGIHEKKYAWMDEGMASFSEFFLKEQSFDFDNDNSYLGSQRVLPVMTPSYLSPTNGLNSYTIGSNSYFALYRLLGKDTFLKCLKTYMDEWKFKHPTPYDFMFTFNRASGMDLNWFWKRWYFDWGYMDMGIRSFENNTLTVENLGGRPTPFNIKMIYSDGSSSEEEVSPMVWKDSSVFKKSLSPQKALASIEIRIPHSNDANKENDVWKIK